ncbi:MAG: aminotransferase class III-fold pyridoxal phosphate-dependent enzyme [Cyanobacteria bacterium HKST-UBA02]|nr:aminotransferase class III-fold pyridoxal phosphate-dependent enzyme [Cyanobacteria bacterium HKST-UBA02]
MNCTAHEARYAGSTAWLERALKTIPLGSQTFSKSKTQYPEGVSPFFLERGLGSRVWDVDGNEYIDFVSSLLSISLGYQDPDVRKAVDAQLDKGTIFSLPNPIEVEVAEKIVEMVPCAEMVRFGKNGSDATAGAIRLARAFTGRDHVAVCGYHGWQDWYIGSTARNLGVPQAVRDLTHTFMYNDIDSLKAIFKQHPDSLAAVILEPMNIAEPAPGFLEEVKDLCSSHKTVLVFDETITGFRFARGGAQELFGVTPDLATFGKGMANGYPIAALVGRAEIMRMMEEIFFSFTFGGETLSLAASLAVLEKIDREPVLASIYRSGAQVKDGLEELIRKHGLSEVCSVAGHPTWTFFVLKDTATYGMWQLKTLYLQEMFARGILTVGTHNMSYAHSQADISALLACYDDVLAILKTVLEKENIEEFLKARPLEPLFKVR